MNNSTKAKTEEKEETTNSNDKWKEMHLMSLDNDVSLREYNRLGNMTCFGRKLERAKGK